MGSFLRKYLCNAIGVFSDPFLLLFEAAFPLKNLQNGFTSGQLDSKGL